VDQFARGGVAARTRSAVGALEGAEADERNSLAIADSRDDFLERAHDDAVHFSLRGGIASSNAIYEFETVHVE